MFGELNPLVAGDFSILAAWENDQEDKVYQMIDYFKDDRWVFITPRHITEAIDSFGIDYPNLPQWLKNLIDDEINIT